MRHGTTLGVALAVLTSCGGDSKSSSGAGGDAGNKPDQAATGGSSGETSKPDGGFSDGGPPGTDAGSCGPVEVRAFPSAEGFGAKSIGGRGGRVIEVTNLNDSGPGSLRACAEDSGPRVCVFRVGGTIALESTIDVHEENSYLTIAGQTAPGDGIQIKNWYLNISYGAHDVIVRHFRIRQGTDHMPQDINNECGGILVYGPSSDGRAVRNVMLDHISVEWTCDDSVQFYQLVQDVTLQWSIIGEGLTGNDYKNAEGVAANSKGLMAGGMGGRWTAHHNLLIHTGSRNPYSKGTPTGLTELPVLDYRNNLIYNWSACHGNVQLGEYDEYGIPDNDASLTANFVGNKLVPGSSSTIDCYAGGLGGKQTKIFIDDNWTPWCQDDCSTLAQMKFIHWEDPYSTLASDSQYRASAPFDSPLVATTPVSELEAVLVAAAGATKPKRDSLDARLVSELESRTGDAGRNGSPWPQLESGTPPQDTDVDGMPDDWESGHGLDPSNASDGERVAPNGYTHLENYLNELAGDTVCQ